MPEFRAATSNSSRRGAGAFPPDGGEEVDTVTRQLSVLALRQQTGWPTTRSWVGSVTTFSDLLRMFYSRAGDYGQRYSVRQICVICGYSDGHNR